MKGWLIWAYDVEGDKYLRCATVLANSIKATQRHNSKVAVVVNQKVSLSEQQKQAFDYVIPIHTDYPAEIMSLGYELSPFQETISIEADCIVCNDVSHWWNVLGQKDALFPGRVYDTCGNQILQSWYRQGFAKHGLADIWSGMFYWQRSNAASDIFKSAKALCLHWRDNGLPFEWTENAANDEFFGKVLARQEFQECIDTVGWFTFTHNRERDQIQYRIGQALTANDFVVGLDGVWVGPWKQQDVLHYHNKLWLTQRIEETVRLWRE